METCKPHDLPTQSNRPADKNNDMGLPDQKYDHLWTSREGTSAPTSTRIGNIYVQPDKDDDEPTLERLSLAPGQKTDLQEDQTINNGILNVQDANYDNAHAKARHQDKTSQTAQCNADTEKQSTYTMGDQKPCHPGTCATENTRKGK